MSSESAKQEEVDDSLDAYMSGLSSQLDNSIHKGKPGDATMDLDKSEPGSDKVEGENVVYTVPKPQWLRALEDRVTDDNQQPIAHLHDTDESNQFVDYKNRNKILGSGDDANTRKSNIESTAPGLILRKRKQVEMTGANSNDITRQSTSAPVDEEKRKPKRVLGPEKPSFLNNQTDDTLVPPQGQSGDGRTSLNDKYGY
ncbi:uncharacterized protein DS421_9g264010 [Arachis hypogaea]|nr:uncharacterized protein DS421_9g264010 [Arachis hypogaea]